MDDKKNSLSEETKEMTSGNDDILEFDDIRNAFDEKEKTQDANGLKDETVSNKKEESDIKDANPEQKDKDVDKKEADAEEKDKNVNKKETDSEEKNKDVEKKETDSEEKDKNADKKEADAEPKEEQSDETEDNKKNLVNNKAISQSKRLADAQAARDAVNMQNLNESHKKEKKVGKGFKIAITSFVAVLALVYIVGFVYFSKNFYPDVAINGTDVSGMNKETAKQTLDDFYKNYVLTLETIDNDKVTIVGQDISMQITLHDELDDCLKKQESYLWFVNVFNHHDYTIGADATWDADALANVYKNMKVLNNKLMIAPEDAYIGVDESGKFAIIKEVLGTTILVESFKAVVEDSLSGVNANVNLKDAGCYKLPKVYDTDEALNSDFNAKKEFANAVIKLQLDDLTLEPGMDLYNAVLEKNGDSYTISKSLVEEYVKKLAEQYDTLGENRTFTSSFDDRKVEINGTAFGYKMNQEATTDAIYNALTTKTSTTVDVVFTKKGYTLQGENDIGDTYIEVNLSEQYVVAYKDGKKVAEGDCVSGNESAGNGTCLGLYAIQDKLSPTVLRGPQKEVTKTVVKKNKKGKKVKVQETTMEYEYESPVTFWMQFNGGFGLHDAVQWRSSYGGSIYYYNGSHGCVNLPYDLAEKLYQNFGIGDPVVVYFWDNENRK